MRRAAGFLSIVLGVTSLVVAVAAPPGRAGGATTPALTVTPSRDLIDPLGDGQFVRATWTGMTPGVPVYLRQCSARPRTVKDCSQTGLLGPGLITAGIADADGSGTIVFQVRVGLVNATSVGDPTKTSFPCDYAHDCSIALFTDDAAHDVDSAVLVRIRFAFPPDACPPSSSGVLSGSGGSEVFRAMLAWEGDVCRDPYSTVAQYVLQSGPEGRKAFVQGLTDFAGMARPFSPGDVRTLDAADDRFAYAPVAASGLGFGFRLYDRVTGEQITDLNLTPELLAEIFTGQLQNWNDPRILALNPGHVDENGIGTLPTKLRPVARADASDVTYLLTSYLWETAHDSWVAGGSGEENPFAVGPLEIFPSTGAVGLFTGARGVTREVARPSQDTGLDFGYIGVMDSSWAALYGLPVADIQNAAGEFVRPTDDAILAGVAEMTVNDDGVTQWPDFTATAPDAYPMPVLSYVAVRQSELINDFNTFDGIDGRGVKQLVRYAVTVGQRALPAGYAPLPQDQVDLALESLDGVPTAPPDDTGGPGNPPGSIPPTDGTLPTESGSGDASGTGTPGEAPAVPIQRGPYIPTTALVSARLPMTMPALMALALGGLLIGPTLLWADRRRRRALAAATDAGADPATSHPKRGVRTKKRTKRTS